MSIISDAAEQALVTAQDALVASARDGLATILAPLVTDKLTVVYVSVSAGTVTLTDGTTSLCWDGKDAWLVDNNDGLTRLAQVTSLADLGTRIGVK